MTHSPPSFVIHHSRLSHPEAFEDGYHTLLGAMLTARTTVPLVVASRSQLALISPTSFTSLTMSLFESFDLSITEIRAPYIGTHDPRHDTLVVDESEWLTYLNVDEQEILFSKK
jgi:hypothetical protein